MTGLPAGEQPVAWTTMAVPSSGYGEMVMLDLQQVEGRPGFPALAAGFDPIEVTEAVAEDLRALYGTRLRRVLRGGGSASSARRGGGVGQTRMTGWRRRSPWPGYRSASGEEPGGRPTQPWSTNWAMVGYWLAR